MQLPGLERLLHTCARLKLSSETRPSVRSPPAAGTLLSGHPLDPMLAAFYERFAGASFATREAGLTVYGVDGATNELEEQSRWWRDSWQEKLAIPLFVFGGEPLLADYFATVPGLADEQARQPVVLVDTYEEPFALPIASNVDRLFELYSYYLEELVATPGYEEEGAAVLTFPWDVPRLLAGDVRLVGLIRAGRFAPLMKKTGSTPKWVEQVLAAARRS